MDLIEKLLSIHENMEGKAGSITINSYVYDNFFIIKNKKKPTYEEWLKIIKWTDKECPTTENYKKFL